MALLIKEKDKPMVCLLILLTTAVVHPSSRKNRTVTPTTLSPELPDNVGENDNVTAAAIVFPDSDPVFLFSDQVKQILIASGRHDAKSSSAINFTSNAFTLENEGALLRALNRINNWLLPYKYHDQRQNSSATAAAVSSD